MQTTSKAGALVVSMRAPCLLVDGVCDLQCRFDPLWPHQAYGFRFDARAGKNGRFQIRSLAIAQAVEPR